MGGDRCEIFSWGNMTGWNLIAILREQASQIVDPSIVQVQKHLDIELITDYSLAAEDPKKIVNYVHSQLTIPEGCCPILPSLGRSRSIAKA